jgi:hypothetical protein
MGDSTTPTLDQNRAPMDGILVLSDDREPNFLGPNQEILFEHVEGEHFTRRLAHHAAFFTRHS